MRQKTALPLLGIIIPHLPLFPIHYHTCGRASEMDQNTIVSDSNATVPIVGLAPPLRLSGKRTIAAVLHTKGWARIYITM
ncbi:hypothetical protein GQ44DRAFT_68450 [Phaeosphaeriaceae sp. PMI808]|nr:hypothetical protein GQ44DRAFT_68450 [Phaeosphaeriaceae sp. PMI808]